MTNLTSMRNIGKEMARKLAAVGIRSPEELLAAGSKEAFFRLKTVFPQVCLVHLYALEFNSLSADKRRELKRFSDQLK